MRRISLMVAIATFCLGSFSAHAQDDGQQMLTQGVDSGSGSGQQYALRVLAPLDGTSSIGGRMMLDENMGIDLDINFDLKTDDDIGNGVAIDTDNRGSAEGLTLGISGALINYMSKGRVAPYYKVGAGFTLYTGDKSKGIDNNVSVFGGLGAEFFVIPEFSIFAEAGLDVPLAPDFSITSTTSQVGLAYYF